MARAPISEYKAKTLLLGDDYTGVRTASDTARAVRATFPSERLVAKVDQGIKKRMKCGLITLDVSADEVCAHAGKWYKDGYTHVLVEPYVPHDPADERYLSIERVRGGIKLLYMPQGGIDVEAHTGALTEVLLKDTRDIASCAAQCDIPEPFLTDLIARFDAYHFSFCEINPLVVAGEKVRMLDCAVLVDNAAAFFVDGAWDEHDLVYAKARTPEEVAVTELDAKTPASLKLSVLNSDGSLFLLLSSGGASIVIADEAYAHGHRDAIANYGEYSGAPTRSETYLYAKEILSLLAHSSASHKTLIIAGGVANFTDVYHTFLGIIDALDEVKELLKEQGVRVYVRRGGPNEARGLAAMETFLSAHGLLGSVAGSDALLTKPVHDVFSHT